MATVNDDLLTEILLRLPTKTLLPLKIVCKQWRSLICSRRFSVLHTLRHPSATATATALLVQQGIREYCHISLFGITPFTIPGHVLQSCNGLLLCQSTTKSPIDGAEYCVYNPSTGLRRPLQVVPDSIQSLTLAFDPSKSAFYKLVCVRASDFPCSPFSYQIVVFDSEISSWNVAIDMFTFGVFWKTGVYWNNAVYWDPLLSGLLYFDIYKGTIGQCPKITDRNCSHFHVESAGRLHYITSNRSNLSVYEMENDHSGWSIKYENEYGKISVDITVVGIVRTQNKKELLVLFAVSGKLMVYNTNDESFQKLKDFNHESSLDIGPEIVHQFVETLAPV